MSNSGNTENPFKHKRFWTDTSCLEYETRVLRHAGEDGIVLEECIFYPGGGGQPCDTGCLTATGRRIDVISAEEEPGGEVVLRMPGQMTDQFPVGSSVKQYLDRDKRHRHMRIHTALHLLTVVLPFPVTGGQVSPDKGRLDFKMPALPGEKDEIEARLNALVSSALPVVSEWITADAFERNIGLVKTQMVQPPILSGMVRLVRIGTSEEPVDLQACGGTHVEYTSDVGAIRIAKIENKGRDNRRVSITVS